MIDIKCKEECCGCGACSQICPKHCIDMQADEEGFLYPVVNKELCCDCGLCDRTCPYKSMAEKTFPNLVYAMFNKDEQQRFKSSSGGIFILLAKHIITQKGVVYGARFDTAFNVVHARAQTLEEVKPIMGSKYVQSFMGNCYRQCKDDLSSGRQVLFSGTPCQITGLKNYLRRDYDNLFTIEVICHGVPSPLVWQEYLKSIRISADLEISSDNSKIFYTPYLGIKEIETISFKDKRNGWENYGFSIKYIPKESKETNNPQSSKDKEDKKDLYVPMDKNHFMAGFLQHFYLRPSCFECKFRQRHTSADITLGDFWGITNCLPQMNDNKGVSAVMVNSIKGQTLLKTINNSIRSYQVKYEDVVKGNPSLCNSYIRTKKRNKFFTIFKESGFEKAFHKANHINKFVVYSKKIYRKLRQL